MIRLIATYASYTFAFFFLAAIFPPDIFIRGFGVFIVGCFLIALTNYIPLRRELQRVEQRGRSGYLYGFFDRGTLLPCVKIGRESTLGSRLRQHRTAAPIGIRVVFSFPVRDAVYAEGVLHRRYAFSRLAGNEWFWYSGPVMVFEILLLRVFGA